MFKYDQQTRTFWFNWTSMEADLEFCLVGMVLGETSHVPGPEHINAFFSYVTESCCRLDHAKARAQCQSCSMHSAAPCRALNINRSLTVCVSLRQLSDLCSSHIRHRSTDMHPCAGLAIYNGVILDVHFPLVVYKKLLGRPVDFQACSIL